MSTHLFALSACMLLLAACDPQFSHPGSSEEAVIYGSDDRIDPPGVEVAADLDAVFCDRISRLGPVGYTGCVTEVVDIGAGQRLPDLPVDGEPADTAVEDAEADHKRAPTTERRDDGATERKTTE